MLSITRNDGETWREAVARYSKPWRLQEETLTLFDRLLESGEQESEAAFTCLYAWDLIEYEAAP
jgi:hypothetical protein